MLFSSISIEALHVFIVCRLTKCRMWVISVSLYTHSLLVIRLFRWPFNIRPYVKAKVKWTKRRRISSFHFLSNILFGEIQLMRNALVDMPAVY